MTPVFAQQYQYIIKTLDNKNSRSEHQRENALFFIIKFSQLPLVTPKHIHVKKKHVLIGYKGDMFCCQTFEVWSRQLLSTFCFCSTKYSLQEFLDVKASTLFPSKKYAWQLRKKEIWTECGDQKHTLKTYLWCNSLL